MTEVADLPKLDESAVVENADTAEEVQVISPQQVRQERQTDQY